MIRFTRGRGIASWRPRHLIVTAAGAALLAASPALAHGIVGKRFFPATLVTDDPFVADELSLPTVSTLKSNASGDEPATRETAISIDIAKRVTPNFAIELSESYVYSAPDGEKSQAGFDNLGVGMKYQLFALPEHELVASIGLDADVGGTGATRIGAERFSTITPGLFVGKGMGDWFDGAPLLKPLAVTGLVGYQIPTSAARQRLVTDPDTGETSFEKELHPDVLVWGGSVQYSIPYLQSFVRDVGLGAPFNRMIPLVEIALQTPTNRAVGRTTGTVNPGLVWSGQYFQLAAEAQIPINPSSGRGVGAIVQMHFYLDDLFPTTLGKPIFGN